MQSACIVCFFVHFGITFRVQILEQMKLGKPLTPPLSSEVTSWCPSEMNLHQMKCKTSISSQQLKESAYPADGFLVVVDWNAARPFWVSPESEMNFAVVEHAIIHNTNDCNRVELVLDLCLIGNNGDLFSSSKQKVMIYSLAALTPFLYQWEALSKLHQNRISRDLLSPRGGEYFGLKAVSNQQTASLEKEHFLVSCLESSSCMWNTC